MTDTTYVTFSAKATVEGNTLRGTAHVFGQRAMVGGRYEQFDVQAFDEAMKVSDARAFINHDRNLLLGRQGAGTLRVWRENNLLQYEIDLPDTTYARDFKVLVERGDMAESSFGFMPGEVRMEKAADGTPVRVHTKVKAFMDVSPVALPAFQGTAIALRSESVETARSAAVKARHRAGKENR